MWRFSVIKYWDILHIYQHNVSTSPHRQIRDLSEHLRIRNSTEKGQNMKKRLENVATALYQCLHAIIFQTFYVVTQHAKYHFHYISQDMQSHPPVMEKLHGNSTSFENPLADDAKRQSRNKHSYAWLSFSSGTFKERQRSFQRVSSKWVTEWTDTMTRAVHSVWWSQKQC